MALILTDYDLSGGNTNSDSEVSAPGNWRITAYTTGCPARQDIFITVYVEGDNGNFTEALDDKGKAIGMRLRGNTIKSINLALVNATNGRVFTRVPSGATGTLNIDSVNA